MKTLTVAQRAWLAGLFDGEGCFSIYLSIHKPTQSRPNGRRRYALQISLINTSTEAIYLIQSWFGGKVYRHSGGCWVWKLCKRDSQIAFIKCIQSYFVIKASQAKIALEYLNTVLDDKKFGYHPISREIQEIRKSCYQRISAEKEKYSTKKIHCKAKVKSSEIAGNPERAICSQANKEGSETIMETPRGDRIVRHSEESEITDSYGHTVS